MPVDMLIQLISRTPFNQGLSGETQNSLKIWEECVDM